MTEIINLRRARKAKGRQTAQAEAAAKRALHGRTKAEKSIENLERARREALLDGAAIESVNPGE